MSNGHVDPHVPKVNIKDGIVTLTIEVVGFVTGNWAEISGYVIQNDTALPFSAIQNIPAPDPSSGVSSLTAVLPLMPGLDQENDVTVVTRVTQAQVWPTVLGRIQPDSGFEATWQAKSDIPTSNVQPWQPGMAATAPQSSAPASSSGPCVTVATQPDTRYLITVEPVPPSTTGVEPASPSKPAARTSSK